MKRIVTLVLVAFSVFSACVAIASAQGDKDAVDNLLMLSTTDASRSGDPAVNYLPLKRAVSAGSFCNYVGLYYTVTVRNGDANDIADASSHVRKLLLENDIQYNVDVVGDNPVGALPGCLVINIEVNKITGRTDAGSNRNGTESRGDSNRCGSSNMSVSSGYSNGNESVFVWATATANVDIIGPDGKPRPFLTVDSEKGNEEQTASHGNSWSSYGSNYSGRHGSDYYQSSSNNGSYYRTSEGASIARSSNRTIKEAIADCIIFGVPQVINKYNAKYQQPATTVVPIVTTTSSAPEGYTGDPAYIYTEQVYTAVDAK